MVVMAATNRAVSRAVRIVVSKRVKEVQEGTKEYKRVREGARGCKTGKEASSK